VRVYTLKDPDRFKHATFEELWKHDRDTLGKDLLGLKELTIHPDTQHPIDLEVELEEGKGYLGVAAFFLQVQGKHWRQVLPIKDIQDSFFHNRKLVIVLDHHSMQIKKSE